MPFSSSAPFTEEPVATPSPTTEAQVATPSPTTESPVATPPPTELSPASPSKIYRNSDTLGQIQSSYANLFVPPCVYQLGVIGNTDDRTVAPTTAEDEMVYFRIQIDFFDGMGANPSSKYLLNRHWGTQCHYDCFLTVCLLVLYFLLPET